MHFDARDIRTGMDVFTADNVYLGSVIRLPKATPREDLEPLDDPSSWTSGESLGPVPTGTIGNEGPTSQSAEMNYANGADEDSVFSSGSFVVGKWFGMLGRKHIPVAFVQAVSAERIVLRRSDNDVR